MSIGRNDPCPCGSGKKYKKCCLESDRLASRAAHAAQIRELVCGADRWEADVIPLPGGLRDDPATRLGAALVVAGGFVVQCRVVNRASPEPEGMAAVLAEAVLAGAGEFEMLPQRVVVRDAEVATALRRELLLRSPQPSSRTPVPTVAAGLLTDLDEAAFALLSKEFGRRTRHRPCCPETWAAWGLPKQTIGELFHVVANYYRAAPWKHGEAVHELRVTTPAGRSWTATVLGSGGHEYGIALYSDPEDYSMLMRELGQGELFANLAGRIISLTFDSGSKIPRSMRTEVAAAGWEVASASAYPRIATVNTPAGGLMQRDVEDLIAVLTAVPRFFADRGARAGTDPSPWSDPQTKAVVVVERGERATDRVPWLVEDLLPGDAQGPGAQPAAAVHVATATDDLVDVAGLAAEHEVMLERYARHLIETKGLAESTVAKHRRHADTFCVFLTHKGVPLRALHELDLREYLYDWYPRKVKEGEGRRRALLGSLSRFFEYLAIDQDIWCPWAAEVLSDEEAFRGALDGVPPGYFWDAQVAEWQRGQCQDWFARLLLPCGPLDDDGTEWGDLMGMHEAELLQELSRRWLLWRDELLRSGVTDSSDLATRLMAAQREWQQAPHAGFGGRSPVQVIREEREESARR